METTIPTTFDHLPEVVKRMGEQYSNKGKRELSSVLSDGRYAVYPEMFPGENARTEKPEYC